MSKEAWAESVLFEIAAGQGVTLNAMVTEPIKRERMLYDDRRAAITYEQRDALIVVKAMSPEFKEER